AILRGALGILDQHTSLRPFHETDEKNQANDHGEQPDDGDSADRTGPATFHQVADERWHLCDNTGHDDEGDTVADTTAGDLFTQPHQEQRAAYQTDNRTNRSEEHTSELQSRENLVCRLLLEKKKKKKEK